MKVKKTVQIVYQNNNINLQQVTNHKNVQKQKKREIKDEIKNKWI